jgi:membrane protease YdiL (CAAX protease family)
MIPTETRSRFGAFARDIFIDPEHGGEPLDRRSVWVMLYISVSLTLSYYVGNVQFFNNTFGIWANETLGPGSYTGLLPYWYWTFSSVMLRMAIPLAIIVWGFRESPREYGYRLWEPGHAKVYLWLFMIMFPLLAACSFLPSFQAKYPFYPAATENVGTFVLYEISYGLQFIALESFFRGFLLFALFRRFGYHAVVIMTIPYCMIHFGKPMPETLGAIVAGLALGSLAIRSRSWLPGALLHWGIGLSMDVLATLQKS